MFDYSGSNSVHICEEPDIVDTDTDADADNNNDNDNVDQDKETKFGELECFE